MNVYCLSALVTWSAKQSPILTLPQSFSGDLRRLRCLEAHRVTWTGQPKQITFRQHQPKVCVHLFHGQDWDQFQVFGAFLVQFGLRIMHQEGKCIVWIFGFFRSKSSNLEVQKIWDMLGQIGPYLKSINIWWKKYIDSIWIDSAAFLVIKIT